MQKGTHSSSLEESVKHLQESALIKLKSTEWPTPKSDWFKYTSVLDLKSDFRNQTPLKLSLANNIKTTKGIKITSFAEVLASSNVEPRQALLELLASIPTVFEKDVFILNLLTQIDNARIVYISNEVDREVSIDLSTLIADSPLCIVIVQKNTFVQAHLKKIFSALTHKNKPWSHSLLLWSIGDDSEFKLTSLEDHGSQFRSIDRQLRIIQRGAKFIEHKVQGGGVKSQSLTYVDLRGVRAEFHLKLASSTANEQQYDGIYNVLHSAQSTLSQMDVWSVAQDRSKTIFNGSVEIPKGSIHSEAHQKNRNMLLSDRAEIDSLPKLEIACDEVKCSHGASVTTVHDEQLYYFQTRGVSKEEASRLIVSGFVEPVLEEVKDESLQTEMRAVFLRQVYSELYNKELL